MSCGLYGGFGYISQYYSSKTALLSGTTNTIQFTCNAFVGPEHYTAIILKLWTSGTSIYWKWDAFFKGNGTSYIDINLKKVTFIWQDLKPTTVIFKKQLLEMKTIKNSFHFFKGKLLYILKWQRFLYWISDK
ncbi:hypothetical protein [Spiroplasma sp. ald]|uniref:hypothetical protein n=1 Tax=Spiroplasma sp. ald TaxID=2490849 RepID=UPI0037DDCB58